MRQFDVLVASHGEVAAAMIEAAAMICGGQEGLAAVGLDPSETPETFGARLEAAIDPSRPTLILTDLFGGTPNNVACSALRKSSVRCIAGVNLGLVIEAITSTEPLDDELVARLVEIAREGVVDVASRLVREEARPAH